MALRIREIRLNIPNYSEDIRAAWQVVEKGGHFLLEQKSDHWVVSFGIIIAKAKTAPEAICLAALKATVFEFLNIIK